MEKKFVKFYALNLSVSDLRKSIAFYQKLGFEIRWSDSTNYSVSTYMKLSEKSDFMICLTQMLVERVVEDQFTIEIEANEEMETFHDEAFVYILEQGIRYENLAAEKVGKVICAAGTFKDPDDFTWILADHQ